MSKNQFEKLNELDELLANSQRLNVQFGNAPSSGRALKRSVSFFCSLE